MNTDLLIEFDARLADAARPIHPIREKSDDLASAPPDLQTLAKANGFAGEQGQVLATPSGALLGVGDGRDRFILAAASERLPAGDYKVAGPLDPIAGLGWLLGGYRFDRYRASRTASARLIAPAGAPVTQIRRDAEAIGMVRDLINTPAGDMLPDALQEAAFGLAARLDAKATAIVGDDLLARNFPLIHAVGRASSVAPRLIELIWGRPDARKVTIIGKGVCFDSGGLNIKGESGMAIMKKDMGGAATALGLAQLIMGAGLDVRLRVLIPAVENAISAASFRPGDILRSRAGLSVEIGNTDAEGRLVLADALTLAAEDAPDLTITLATLTGAARIALGPELPPFYTDDVRLAGDIEAAARATEDPVWRMPLWANYESMLSSPIADLNNISGNSFAGSIIAALFLKKFAPKSGSWAHFDIYAWRPKAAPGRPAGGEAQAMRALYETLARQAIR